MLISSLKISNYKSFNDSGWIQLKNGMNIVIGQNNSGKTALLESFKLYKNPSRPHRSLANEKEELLNPISQFDFDLIISGEEIKKAIYKAGSSYHIPIDPLIATTGQNAFIQEFFDTTNLNLQLTASSNDGYTSRIYPSHNFFENSPHKQKLSLLVTPQIDKQSHSIVLEANSHDNYFNSIQNIQDEKIYFFQAERFALGSAPASVNGILNSNAGNLAGVLTHLMGENPDLFNDYNSKINEIFPNIKRVSTIPIHNAEHEIKLWSVETKTRRPDLAFSLKESGTGVGQVLAILYIAMNQPSSIIVIDEPNSFLHPGAAKKLIQILKNYNHQYVISTHSPELIIAADPQTLNMVTWESGESKVTPLDSKDIASTKAILDEVGVGLGEVFGADSIIWVEGPTEVECFPKLLKSSGNPLPLGIEIISLKSTGDLEQKNKIKAESWFDIYTKLSSSNILIPPTIAFSLDRELRKPQDITEMDKISKGKVTFLPRRLFECYVLNISAIVHVLNQELIDDEVSDKTITTWLTQNAHKYHPTKKWDGNLEDKNWLEQVDAATLLSELFSHVSDGKVNYTKTIHTSRLTDWILENNTSQLEEVTKYVTSLLPKK